MLAVSQIGLETDLPSWPPASISTSFYIDNGRCIIQADSVTKRLAIAEPQQPVECCPGAAKLRAKDVGAYAALFKALSDETRLSILGFLIAKGDAVCACHIEDYVKELSQPTISHHLRLLREAGLLTAERKGTWVYYAINKTVRDRLVAFVALLG